jgi:hypothetical protein
MFIVPLRGMVGKQGVWQPLLAAATGTTVFDMSAIALCKPMLPYILVSICLVLVSPCILS